MANTLRFKRGLVSGIPTAALGEPLFTTDTFDLYIGNGTGNTRFQKYIASGTTSQLLRGDGSLLTMPIVLTSPSNGQVLKFNGTNWVNDSDAGITGSGAAGQVAYFTGATTQAGSNDLIYNNTNKSFQLSNSTNSNSTRGLYLTQTTADGAGNLLIFQKSRGGVITSGTTIAVIDGEGFDGASYQKSARISFATSGTISSGIIPGTITFVTSNSSGVLTSRTSINESGLLTNIGNFQNNGNTLLGGSVDNGARLQVSGNVTFGTSGTGLFWDNTNNRLGIGTNAPQNNIDVVRGTAGAMGRSTYETASFSYNNDIKVGIYTSSSNVAHAAGLIFGQTNLQVGSTYPALEMQYVYNSNVADNNWRLNYTGRNATGLVTVYSANLFNVYADGRIIINPVGSGVTVSPKLILGTSTDNGARLQVSGTSTFSDSMAIGGTASAQHILRIVKNITGSTISYGNSIISNVQSDVTSGARVFYTQVGTAAASFTLPELNHYYAVQGTFGAGSAVTSQFGYRAHSSLTGATNNYGFYGDIASGTGRWNLYMNGTAANYLAGDLRVGTTTALYSAAGRGVININGTSTAILSLNINSNTNTGGYLYYDGTTINLLNNTSGGSLLFSTAGTERMRLDASGNLGLGVTPSAWRSNENVIQVGSASYVGTSGAGASDAFAIGGNYYINSSNQYVYRTSTNANRFEASLGEFRWFNTGSGTAGNTFTFSQRMTLTAAGRLLLGSGAATSELMQVNGTMKVTGASTFGALVTVNNNITTALNQNATTYVAVTNTDVGVNTKAEFQAFSRNGGTTRFGRNSNLTTAYKMLNASDGYVLNETLGDFAILNDNATGSIKMAAGGSSTAHFTIASTGAATFSNTINSTSANGLAIGSLVDTQRIQYGSDGATSFTLLTAANAYAGLYISDLTAATAIAIGTTPDTNKPFKILKNINATVGINFENTSTGATAFSAIQMGTDVTGGTKFTNLVYSSSGVSASGVYNPDGTSLINNGSGGLNFLGTPIRFYTGGSNGVLRYLFDNEGAIQYTATTPTTNAVDGYKQYSADVVAGNAAPHFRTENGAVIKLYQETTGVGNSIMSLGGGSNVLDDTTFDGYTLKQIVKALRNQGILA